MAETKKKVAKKPSSKQVDSIIVILIAIIVLAVVAGGIVLITSFKTEPLVPVTNPNEETTDKGTYSDYLKKLKAETESVVEPIDNELITKIILGTDNYMYIVYKDVTKNTDTIPGSVETGSKYVDISGVVDLFKVTTDTVHLFVLNDNGVLYEINLTDATNVPKDVKEVVEVSSSLNQIEVKKFDGTIELLQ